MGIVLYLKLHELFKLTFGDEWMPSWTRTWHERSDPRHSQHLPIQIRTACLSAQPACWLPLIWFAPNCFHSDLINNVKPWLAAPQHSGYDVGLTESERLFESRLSLLPWWFPLFLRSCEMKVKISLYGRATECAGSWEKPRSAEANPRLPILVFNCYTLANLLSSLFLCLQLTAQSITVWYF